MARTPSNYDDLSDPVELEEPDYGYGEFDEPENIWLRGLWMLLFAVLFALAETILWVVALVQFLWMVFTKEKNELLVEFGRDLGKWLQEVARFQSGATEVKPFPWKRWG